MSRITRSILRIVLSTIIFCGWHQTYGQSDDLHGGMRSKPRGSVEIIYDTICHGEVYDDGYFHVTKNDYGEEIRQRTYTDTLNLGDGSMRVLNLYIETYTRTIVAICCSANGYHENGFTIDDPEFGTQTYTKHGYTKHGCDSTIYLDLTVVAVEDSTYYDTICYGGSYSGHGVTWNSPVPGDYDTTVTYYTPRPARCEYKITTNLHVEELYDIDVYDTVCENTPYQRPGIDTTGLSVGNHLITAHLESIKHCDSTVRVHLYVAPEYDYEIDAIICKGGVYDRYGFHMENLDPGVYHETHNEQTIHGCDSIVTLNLTVGEVYDITYYDTIGYGSSYNDHGFYFYYPPVGDNYQQHYYRTKLGCDSLVKMQLYVAPLSYTEHSAIICEGESFNDFGFEVENPEIGTHIITHNFLTTLGFDSTVVLHLTVGEVYEDLHIQRVICEEESYTSEGFSIINPPLGDTSQTLYLKSVYGCDSIVTLDLLVAPKKEHELFDTICDKEHYTRYNFDINSPYLYFGDNTVPGDNIFYQHHQTPLLCDSTVILHLYAYPIYTITYDTAVCEKEILGSFMGYESTKPMLHDTTIVRSFKTIHDCDSTIIINITVPPIHNIHHSDIICLGDEYHKYNYDTTFTTLGHHYDTIYYQTDPYGCDSILYFDLLVVPVFDTLFTDTICQGDPYLEHGFELYDLPVGLGHHTINPKTEYGCDNIINLDLFVTPTYNFTSTTTLCEGEEYNEYGIDTIAPVGENQLNAAYETVFGCDSIYQVTLIVGKIDSTYIEASTCVGIDYNEFGFHETCDEIGVIYDTLVEKSELGCDKFFFLELTVNSVYDTTFTDTICQNEEYKDHGFSLPANLPAGLGTHQLTLQTNSGCDSIINLKLFVKPAYDIVIDTLICEGESLNTLNFTFDLPSVGEHSQTQEHTTILGCDSIVTMNLSVMPIHHTPINAMICHGESYNENGFHYDNPAVGEFFDTLELHSVYGCDSIVMLELIVAPTYDTLFTDTICSNDIYDDHGFHKENLPAGEHDFEMVLPTIDNCDSVVRLHLHVNQAYDMVMNDISCFGDDYDRYNFHAENLSVGDTIMTQHHTSVDHCDSIVTMVLSVMPLHHTKINTHICVGDSYNENGFHYDNPPVGEIFDTLELYSVYGCDSIVTLDLLVAPVFDTTFTDAVCFGEAYHGYGFEVGYQNVGHHEFRKDLYSVYGCDSVVSLNLYVAPTYNQTIYDTICEGDEYHKYNFNAADLTPGDTLLQQNPHTDIFGCDSIINLNLHVIPLISFSFFDTICESEPYTNYDFNESPMEPGIYDLVRESTTEYGCTTTFTVHLTVGEEPQTDLHEIICYGEDYIGQGFSFINPEIGTHYDTLSFKTALGCDSISVMHLSVEQPYIFEFADTMCLGGNYNKNGFNIIDPSVGIHNVQLDYTTVLGCDSIYKLVLLVNPVYDTTIFDTICFMDEYHENGFDITDLEIGKYNDSIVFQSTYGCDSIVRLDLTVTQSHHINLFDTICYGQDYHGFNFDTIRPEVGNVIMRDTFLMGGGCDSIVTMHLTVAQLYDVDVFDTICYNNDYNANGFHIINPSVGTHLFSKTFESIAGCDSVVRLNLLVTSIYQIEYYDTACFGERYENHNFDTIGLGIGTHLLQQSYVTSSGCDSIEFVHLIVGDIYNIEFEDTVCSNEHYGDHGFDIDNLEVGMNYDTLHLKTTLGCDSIVSIKLFANESFDIDFYDTICFGENYHMHGFNIIHPQLGGPSIMQNENLTSHGCDSITRINLYVVPVYDTTYFDTICVNETYDNYGFHFDNLEVGTMIDTIFDTTIFGCDSIKILNLLVNPVYDVHFTDTVCFGEEYKEHGFDISATELGIITDTLHMTSAAGCDSVISVELTVAPKYDIDLYDTICFGESYNGHGFVIINPAVGTTTVQHDAYSSFGCDSITRMNLFVAPTHDIVIFDTICFGEEYHEYNFDTAGLEVGTYQLEQHLHTAYQCDSIVTLNLLVGEVYNIGIEDSICSNEVYDEFGFHYDGHEVGEYFDTLFLKSITNCDSVVSLKLIVSTAYDYDLYDTICSGEDYNNFGFHFIRPSSGDHTAQNDNVTTLGCDSIVRMNLFVAPVYSFTIADTVCANDSYDGNGFHIDDLEAGIIMDTMFMETTLGCDSLKILELFVAPVYDTTFNEMICFGESYDSHGFTYENLEVGTLEDSLILKSVFGCDSIVRLNLFVAPVYDTVIFDTTCYGVDYENYNFHVINPTSSPVIMQNEDNTIYGCDSLTTLNLFVAPIYDITLSDTICFGEAYQEYNFDTTGLAVGIHILGQSLTTVHGCDSTVTVNLVVGELYSISFSDTICSNQTYTEHGFNIDSPEAGIFNDTLNLKSILGCDSIVTLQLYVNPSYTIDFYDTICFGEDYENFNLHYIQPPVGDRIVEQDFTSGLGCDSAFIIHIHVAPTYDINLYDTICQGQDYHNGPFDTIQPMPGVCTMERHLFTAIGCDSIVTMNLFVGEKYDTLVIDTICRGESYFENGFAFDSLEPGIYHDSVLLNSICGCDSIVYLKLFVGEKHHVVLYDTACFGPDYIKYGFHFVTPKVGEHFLQQPITTVLGCDSLVDLHLFIAPTYDTILYDTICEGEEYHNLGFDTVNPHVGMNILKLDLVSEFGCDSIVTMNLLVGEKHETVIKDTICEGDVYDDYGFHAQDMEAGLYRDTLFLSSVLGCDSLVYLELNVIHVFDSLITDTICYGSDYDNHGFTLINPEVGSYSMIQSDTTDYGCDSIWRLNLTVAPLYDTLLYDTICFGEEYHGYGFDITDSLAAGVHFDTLFLQSMFHCDSTVVLNLLVGNVYETIIVDTICEGKSYTDNNFNIEGLEAGLHLDTLALQTTAGCDSILYLELQVMPTHETVLYDTTCFGLGYHDNGFDTIGLPEGWNTLTNNLLSIYGCDSVVNVNVFVAPVHHIDINASICAGGSYHENGFDTINPAPGLHEWQHEFSSVYGCDSIVVLHLFVDEPSFTNVVDTACLGDIYTGNGFTISCTEIGIHNDTTVLVSSTGCDSTIYLELQVMPSYTINVFDTICFGEGYNIGGIYISPDSLIVGDNYDTIFMHTTFGCDSLTCLDIYVKPSYFLEYDTIICEGQDYHGHGFDTINPAAGSYQWQHVFETDLGCDSIVVLNLLVGEVYEIHHTDTVCSGNEYHGHGFHEYDLAFGMFHDTMFKQSIYGCDSIVILDLLVASSDDVDLYDTICEGEDYNMFGFDLHDLEAGTHDDTLLPSTAFGCDGAIYLHLFVAPVHNVILYDTICFGQDYDNENDDFDTINPAAGLCVMERNYASIYGCDSTVRLNLYVGEIFNIFVSDTVCKGESYHEHGFHLDSLEVGTYYDTMYYNSIAHCDSIIYLMLNVGEIYDIQLYDTICHGTDYNGFDFHMLNPDEGTHRIQRFLKTKLGCDSIATLNLTVAPVYDTVIFDTACIGFEYDDHGFHFDSLAIGLISETHSYESVFGCDSTVTLHLTVGDVYDTLLIDSICFGEIYDRNNFYIDSLEVGIHNDSVMLATTLGCDSLVRLELHVLPSYIFNEYDTICEGDVYHYNDTDTILPVGWNIFDNTFLTTLGCDSIFRLNVLVAPVHENILFDTACINDGYYNGNGLNITDLTVGSRIDTIRLTSMYGCDSTVILNLLIGDVYDTIIIDSICFGEVYDRNGFNLDSLEVGIHNDSIMLASSLGCDSLVRLQLHVLETYEFNLYSTICEGGEYHDDNFDTINPPVGMNVIVKSFENIYGCDSSLILNLYVAPNHDIVINDTTCDNIHYQDYGFDTTGLTAGLHTMQMSLQSAYGCDSIVTLELFVGETFVTDISDQICFGEEYHNHGFNFDSLELGVWHDTLNLTSVLGCDSIVALELNVVTAYDINWYDTICDGSEYHDHGFDTILPPVGMNIWSHHFTSISGCDSTVTMNLMVAPVHNIEIFDTVCLGEEYHEFGFDYDSITIDSIGVGMIQDTLFLTSSFGCDSTVMLNLSIGGQYQMFITDTICFGSSYYENGFFFDEPEVGIYDSTITMASVFGCDSIVSLELTVAPVYDTLIFDTICFGEDYHGNGFDTINPEAGVILMANNMTGVAGCDSIVTLNLFVAPAYHFDFTDTICLGEGYNQHGFVIDSIDAGTHIIQHEFNTIYGCDSTLVLNLTVNESYEMNIYDTICFGESYNSFNFQINNPDTGLLVETQYLSTIFNCDSIVSLNLFVAPVYHFEVYDSICDGDDYNNYGLELENMTPGIYDFTSELKTVHGCDSIFDVHIKVDYVYINPEQINGLSNVYVSTNMVTGVYEYYIDSLPDCSNYVWTLDNENWLFEPDGRTCKITVTTPEIAELTVWAGNHCGEIELKKTITAGYMSIDEQGDIELSIYPNPCKDFVNIESTNIEKVKIFSPNGVLLREEHYDRVNEITIDLGRLANSLYLIEVITSEGRSLRRVTKALY